jgi:hypothetical protein
LNRVTFLNLLELDAENFDEAKVLQEKIAKEDWDANKEWLNTVRRIILRK